VHRRDPLSLYKCLSTLKRRPPSSSSWHSLPPDFALLGTRAPHFDGGVFFLPILGRLAGLCGFFWSSELVYLGLSVAPIYRIFSKLYPFLVFSVPAGGGN